MNSIYLDYLATTPVCEESSKAMIELLTCFTKPEGCWGNPGSEHHVYGRLAKEKLEGARRQVAKLVNASNPDEICFESGSTESINHAIKGCLKGNKRNHVVLSAIEHPAVVEAVTAACKEVGGRFTIVQPDEFGIVQPEDVAKCCIPQTTAMVSIMLANNEVGSVMDWKRISSLVREIDPEIILHVDASQACGKIPVNVQELGVDMLTIAGHKLYAPKGIGALWIRTGVTPGSFIHGAGHERGRRAGTENVLLAVGLGEACEAAMKTCLSEKGLSETRRLRNLLFNNITRSFSVKINGPIEEKFRLPGALSISFNESCLIGSEIARLAGEQGLAFSAGAACHSGQKKPKPSKVLKAIGMDDVSAISTIRLCIGRYTTEKVSFSLKHSAIADNHFSQMQEVEEASSIIIKIVNNLLSSQDN